MIEKGLCDGCYDLLHFGHMNGFRQASEKCDYLVVGVHSAESIRREKTEPVMGDEERYYMVESCRWVKEVWRDAPFVSSIKEVEKRAITKVFHGNDFIGDCLGNDCYASIKEKGFFEFFERTEFISTTELVGRMLYRKNSDFSQMRLFEMEEKNLAEEKREYLLDLLKKFEIPKKEKKGKVVYVDGTFDMFHAGNASFFKKAKENGDYLIVGIHSSRDSIKEKKIAPVQTLIERQITVSGIKYVDEIITHVPFYVTEEFVKANRIDLIIYGKSEKYYENVKNIIEIKKIVSDFPNLSTKIIIKRIFDNYEKYRQRNIKRGYNMDLI